jgi:hypothetical protein
MGARTQRKKQTAKKHHSLGFWNGMMKQKRYSPDHPAFPEIKMESVSPPGGMSGIGNQSWRSLIEWVEEQRKREVSASSSLRVRVPAFQYLYELEVSG